MPILVTALLVGLAAGVLSGLFGIGGGVVMVPAMVVFLGFAQKTATGTSLAALALPVSALAAYRYWKADHVDLRVAAVLAAGIVVGSFLSSGLALQSSDLWLRRGFALLLVVTAVRLVATS